VQRVTPSHRDQVPNCSVCPSCQSIQNSESSDAKSSNWEALARINRTREKLQQMHSHMRMHSRGEWARRCGTRGEGLRARTGAGKRAAPRQHRGLAGNGGVRGARTRCGHKDNGGNAGNKMGGCRRGMRTLQAIILCNRRSLRCAGTSAGCERHPVHLTRRLGRARPPRCCRQSPETAAWAGSCSGEDAGARVEVQDVPRGDGEREDDGAGDGGPEIRAKIG
jgi:hypothetical protein